MSNSTLRQAVQSTLSTFLNQRCFQDGDIAQDVYRTMFEEAHLLLERQLVYDALDLDPFQLMKANDNGDEDTDEKENISDTIARFKNILKVISCSRVATVEGYSSIQADLQLNNDGKMQDVEQNVQLHFSFLREPQHYTSLPLEQSDVSPSTKIDCCDKDCASTFCCNGELLSTEKLDVAHYNSVTIREERSDISDFNQAKKRKIIQSENKNIEHSHLLMRNTATINTNAEINDDIDDYSCNDFKPSTIVSYKVSYSVDYGKMKNLFYVVIYAFGKYPSVVDMIPIIDKCDYSINTESGMETSDSSADFRIPNDQGRSSKHIMDEFSFNEMEQNTVDEDVKSHNKSIESRSSDLGDHFKILVDSENVSSFLEHVNMIFNEKTVFHFLLTLPFYEHEWNISDLLLSFLFDDENESNQT